MGSQFKCDLLNVVESISYPRLSVYGYHQGITQEEILKVLAGYHYNIALSEAFYPSLQLCEVVLRNQLHE